MKSLYRKVSIVLLLFSSGIAVAEIYKCTDAQGKTRYTDKPCSGNAVIITLEKAPSVSEGSEQRMEKTQRLLRAYDAEHAEKRAQEEASKAEKIKRQQKCAKAQQYQRGVTQASRVYSYDEKEQRYDLNTEERAAEESKAQQEVERWCDKD
jgi:hypothetical protein